MVPHGSVGRRGLAARTRERLSSRLADRAHTRPRVERVGSRVHGVPPARRRHRTRSGCGCTPRGDSRARGYSSWARRSRGRLDVRGPCARCLRLPGTPRTARARRRLPCWRSARANVPRRASAPDPLCAHRVRRCATAAWSCSGARLVAFRSIARTASRIGSGMAPRPAVASSPPGTRSRVRIARATRPARCLTFMRAATSSPASTSKEGARPSPDRE